MTAAEKILEKQLVTSGLNAEEWGIVQTGLRDRALFSSRIGSVRFLQEAQQRLADLLSSAANSDGALTSRAQLVSDLMRSAREAGLATGQGGLTDPGSSERAAVIVDTNAGLARGYTSWTAGNTTGARMAFPAVELVRLAPSRQPRDWNSRWTAEGGKVYGGRMVCLKDDPVLYKISRFGVPYPPFDFGSNMGLDEVSYEDALALGVIAPDWTLGDTQPVADFNAGLEEDLKISGEDDPAWSWLKDVFGKQVSYKDGKVAWTPQRS